MSKKISWYQIFRKTLPVLYGIGLITGILFKNMTVALLFMGSALLAGSFFCGWLCPFGWFQDWMSRFGRALKLPRIRIPQAVERFLRFTRYVLFAFSFTGFAWIIALGSPYSSFMGLITGNIAYITTGLWIYLGVVTLLGLFVDRPFCRYLCQEGARYGILSMARIFTLKRDTEKCISCGACDKACPSQINISGNKKVRNAQCINCFECITACPVPGTLTYGWAFDKKEKKDEKED